MLGVRILLIASGIGLTVLVLAATWWVWPRTTVIRTWSAPSTHSTFSLRALRVEAVTVRGRVSRPTAASTIIFGCVVDDSLPEDSLWMIPLRPTPGYFQNKRIKVFWTEKGLFVSPGVLHARGSSSAKEPELAVSNRQLRSLRPCF